MKYEIGQEIKDLKTGKIEMVIDTTESSICISQQRISEKGIDCTNWFNINDKTFKERFQ